MPELRQERAVSHLLFLLQKHVACKHMGGNALKLLVTTTFPFANTVVATRHSSLHPPDERWLCAANRETTSLSTGCTAQCADGADRCGRPSGGQQLTDSNRRCVEVNREKKDNGATNRAQHHLSSLQTYSRAQWGKHRDSPVLREAAVLQGMRHGSHNKGLQVVPGLHKETPTAARLQDLSRIGD